MRIMDRLVAPAWTVVGISVVLIEEGVGFSVLLALVIFLA
jgi:hypothetical protein